MRRTGLRVGTVLWRIDADPPSTWTWDGFPRPRHRFDPASGTFRVRDAATTAAGAARERYADTGRYIPADHAQHRVVRLTATAPLPVLDLRSEATLDLLGLDARVGVARDPDVWERCHELADAARRWWPDLAGIAYLSRTTPTSSRNVALFTTAGLRVASRPLGADRQLLRALITSHGFTVGFPLSS